MRDPQPFGSASRPFVGASETRDPMRPMDIDAPIDIEKTIAEIEWLERVFSLPDARPLGLADRCAANQRHDRTYAENPWFRLWKRYGV